MTGARRAPAALEVVELSKRFAGTQALSAVNLALSPGEVHGLLGHNGSGKSTLIKILAGYQAADRGQIRFGGRETSMPVPPSVLRDEGIRFVHQSLGLVDRLSVAENLWIDDIAQGSRRGVSFRRLARDAERVLAAFGQDLAVRRPVAELTAVQKANLAIVRAMSGAGARDVPSLLVLDEPTAFLPQHDKQALYDVVRRVSTRGAAVLFVSHFLDEVLDLCDRVTVLRDGSVTVPGRTTADLGRAELVRAIVGDDLAADAPRPGAPGPDVRVAVSRLTAATVRDLSLELRAGEVLGVTGLIGSGCDEVLASLFGAASGAEGSLRLGEERIDLARLTPGGALRAGIGFVPADRNRHGLFRGLSITDNVAVTTLSGYRGRVGLRRGRMRADTRADAGRYGIRPADPTRQVDQLSGGNAQKVLMAKWLRGRPRLLLLEEPTQGVDVGARRQIEQIVLATARDGVPVLIGSADPDQLADLCHRVLVFSAGRVVHTLAGEQVTKHAIAEACLNAPTGLDPTYVEAS